MSDKSKKIILLEYLLKQIATLIIWRRSPRIVAITGSVGKTSTKEAVYAVLKKNFSSRRNIKNYNNEIGLPLTVIGAESGGRSVGRWLMIFLKALWVSFGPGRYPEILVLEMGADRPGDLEYLTRFIKHQVGIVTDVSLSHIEFFKDIQSIAREKSTIIRTLEKNGLAILNIDNMEVSQMKNVANGRVITYGFSDGADLKAEEVFLNYDAKGAIKGISFKLRYAGSTLPVRLNGVLGFHQVYPALAATAVGLEFGMNLIEIAEALSKFVSPPGRLNLFPGINQSYLIDDTYNASPVSTKAAIETLKSIKLNRKILVLGDMLELGENTEKEHRDLKGKILEASPERIILVGDRMNFLFQELKGLENFSNRVVTFDDPITAGQYLKPLIQKDDLILIKGSQSMRMEKVVEMIIADYEKFKKRLCRQNPEWQKISYKKP